MTIAFREIMGSRANFEQDGRKGTVRVFQDEVSPDLATTQLQCPQLGDLLPWDDDQLVVDVRADWEQGSGSAGVQTSRITVTYDTGGATWGGSNPADPFFKSWTLSYFRFNQEIPYAYEDKRTHRWINENQQTQFITSFPVGTTTVYEAREKFIRRVRITQMTPAQWEPIGLQSNKLHKIYARWYLFSVGDIIEQARNTWDVQYTWEYDPGTPNFIIPSNPGDPEVRFPAGFACNNALMYPGSTFCRPPFHKVLVIPNYNAAANSPDWPVFKPICDFELNPDGHLSLPGFTL